MQVVVLYWIISHMLSQHKIMILKNLFLKKGLVDALLCWLSPVSSIESYNYIYILLINWETNLMDAKDLPEVLVNR